MRRFIIVFLLLVLLFVYINAGAEEKLNYKVDVSYPVTDYKKLNSEITKKLKYYQKLFLNEIKDSDITIFNYYTLIINYNSYVYNDILSYVFFVEYFGYNWSKISLLIFSSEGFIENIKWRTRSKYVWILGL